MTPDVIAALAECDKVCPHVHLPLQSASDTVLAQMKRTYTLAEYRDVVAALRAAIPDVALSTDIIVGFPGESADDYAQTVAYMERCAGTARSVQVLARADTRAYAWPETVSETEKGERLERLIALQQSISAERNQAWVGRTTEVLVEETTRRGEHQLFGRTPQFKSVVFPNDGTPRATLRDVRIVGATSNTLLGEPVTSGVSHPALIQIA
jgi:tRNA-2-methylthio-N6-dimethylallyladenosine synthase